jgi:hypothetical protein
MDPRSMIGADPSIREYARSARLAVGAQQLDHRLGIHSRIVEPDLLTGLPPGLTWVDLTRTACCARSKRVEARRSLIPGVADEYATKRSRDRASAAGQTR